MARNQNVVPKRRVLRPLIRAVRRAAVQGPRCRICGSKDVRRSLRRTFLDVVLVCLFLAPYRCRLCRHRFYRFWRPFEKTVEPPRAPVFIMPQQRFEVDPLEPLAIEPAPAVPILPARPLPRLIEHSPATSKPMRREARSILILEGDLSIRKLLRRLLDRRGYFVHEVLEPAGLLTELREQHVDLLIADAALLGPGGGLELLSLGSTHPDLKILALCHEPMKSWEIPGSLLVLTKPFSLDRFLECVDGLLPSDGARPGE